MTCRNKGLTAVMLLAGLCFADTANAQKLGDDVDVGSLSCRTLLQMDGEERANTLIFFHGYMAGKKSQGVINIPRLSDVSSKVVNRCIDEAGKSLMSVFEAESKSQ